MKYLATFSYSRNEFYVVDSGGNQLTRNPTPWWLVNALDALGAPIIWGTIEQYLQECYYSGDRVDEDGFAMTDEKYLEDALDAGYIIDGGLVLDFCCLEIEPTRPDMEVGVYEFPYPGYEQYRTLKRNNLRRIR